MNHPVRAMSKINNRRPRKPDSINFTCMQSDKIPVLKDNQVPKMVKLSKSKLKANG